ncbi:hypothetical protein [Burkholderia phage FLC9]|nr:hypothetical protein [Burkholderia phage FLC9]
MSKMLDFYESILGAAGLIVTSDGCVSVATSKDPKPMTLKGRRLVLPTPEHQRAPNPDTKIAFHPLVENVMRGESEVFERFRLAINARLNVVIGSIVTMLLTLGTSQAEQHKLTPEQSEFLSKVKNADEKTLIALKKIMDSLPAAAHQKLFVSMFIKRGGTVGDKRYSRVGVVHFPFYNDLKKSDGELHGVKLRVKDREALAGLLDYILPEQDIAGVYNRGSNSTIAPSIEALMLSVRAVAAPLNDLLSRFEGVLPDNLTIESGWSEQLDNLDELLPEIRSTPMQAGNEGSVAGTEAEGQSKNQTPGVSFGTVKPPEPARAQVSWGQTAPQPASSPAPVSRGPGGGTDFESLVRSKPALQQAVGWGGSHGWNPGQSWQQAPQRASLSNPSAPVQQSWGGGAWGGGGGGWGNQGGNSWGQQSQQYRL